MAYIVGDSFAIPAPRGMQDAGETMQISTEPLEFVEKEVMARTRPNRSRQLVQYGSYGIPMWVHTHSFTKLNGTADWQPIERGGMTTQIAMATVQRSKESFSLFAMGSMYGYNNFELMRCQQTGQQLDSAEAALVMKQAEIDLDKIAFKGVDGLGLAGYTSALTGIYGLANQPSVTVLTAGVTGDDTSWPTQIATNLADGVQAVIADVLALETYVESNSKETNAPDTLLLPLSFRSVMKGNANVNTDRTLESLVLDRASYIQRIMYWNKLETAGASNKRRVIAYNSRDTDVVRMVVPQEPTPAQPFQVRHGVEVEVTLVTGGVQSKDPTGLVYLDQAA